jgi:hypothetical protein
VQAKGETLRGGSFNNQAENARLSNRNNNHLNNNWNNNGFRVFVSHSLLCKRRKCAPVMTGRRGELAGLIPGWAVRQPNIEMPRLFW